MPSGAHEEFLIMCMFLIPCQTAKLYYMVLCCGPSCFLFQHLLDNYLHCHHGNLLPSLRSAERSRRSSDDGEEEKETDIETLQRDVVQVTRWMEHLYVRVHAWHVNVHVQSTACAAYIYQGKVTLVQNICLYLGFLFSPLSL